MNYLLDTDTLIHLARGLRAAPSATPARQEQSGKARRIVARCRRLQAQGDELCVSAITVAELEFGARGSNNYEVEAAAVQKILAPFALAPFDATTCAVAYGQIRHELADAGTPIGAMDLLIAAHAKALDAVLVTDNLQHFRRVRGLKCESWL
jgi:tRNA(fMet)-specific endonuclease VapC